MVNTGKSRFRPSWPTLRAGRQLRRVQPRPRYESSVNAKSTNAKSTHRAPTIGNVGRLGRWNHCWSGVERAARRNVSAVPPSPHRNPRQPDGAAPDHPRPRSFGCGSPRTGRERSGRDCDDPHGRRPGAGTGWSPRSAATGLFVKEVEDALIAGHIDLAVPLEPTSPPFDFTKGINASVGCAFSALGQSRNSASARRCLKNRR
jgi:hypothetical protein